jgi:hypothetical protein
MSEREWNDYAWIDDVTQMMRDAERDAREREDKRRARELFERVTRLRPIEMSALAQLAYSEGLRPDVREGIVGSLNGDAKLIAIAIVHGDGDGVEQVHRAAAAQLRDWARRLRSGDLTPVDLSDQDDEPPLL